MLAERYNYPRRRQVREQVHKEAARASSTRAAEYLKQHGLHSKWYRATRQAGFNFDFTDNPNGFWTGVYVVFRAKSCGAKGCLIIPEFDGGILGPLVDVLGRWRSGAAVAFSLLYGAAHLGAWAGHFPTTTEMWLWRASGIILMTLPVVYIAYSGAPNPHGVGLEHRPLLCKWSARFVLVLWFWLVLSLLLIALVLYPFARLHLLVEAFSSLRSPPVGTYETPNWISAIPHFG